jgi:hypothetical protein
VAFIGAARPWQGGSQVGQEPRRGMGAVWEQRGGNVQRSTAVMPSGERRRSTRRGRCARDTWGKDIGQGWRCSAGGSTAHGPAGKGRPRRAGPAAARPTRSRAPGAKNSLDRHTLSFSPKN